MEQEKLFWVLLTIFGSVFATGLFVILDKFWWGLFEIILGLVGLIWLIRDHLVHVSAAPIKTPLLILACVGVSIFAGHSISQIVAIRGAVARYVLPRVLTEKQTGDLQEYLSKRKSHGITVKVSPLDSEAIGYASQIFNALKQTNWDVTFSTANADPNTLNNGLCICVVGSNAGPADPKHNPEQLIQAAFRAANIEVNGGASVGAGEYKLFILVGHRPLAIGRRKPILAKLGYWIISLGQRLTSI
jgi:hypothetical protein